MTAFNQLNLSYYFITTKETFEKMLLKINWPDNACRSNSTTYFWTASWKTSQSCSRTACLAQGSEWSSTMALWVFSTFDKIWPDSSVPLKNKFNWVLKFWKSKKWYPVGSFFFVAFVTDSEFFCFLFSWGLTYFLPWIGLVEKRNLVLVSKATTSLINIIIMTMSREFFIDGCPYQNCVDLENISHPD